MKMEQKTQISTPAIAWWSGGITSAVTCFLTIQLLQNVRIIFIDTRNEDEDTYRFKSDCERWYGMSIETITNESYNNIEDVWRDNLSLNVATGAKCSQVLKRSVRERWERNNQWSYQAFGFDINESKRARAMLLNNGHIRPIFPLLLFGYSKEDCLRMLPNDLFMRVAPPKTYTLGFHNNNCFKTGCVQGGIGYWQKIKREYPAKFDKMAAIEHELTEKKGEPVTMLKDQSKNGGLVFLKPHPLYPHIKDISMLIGREPKPLIDCNGFCGTNDLSTIDTYNELNFHTNEQQPQ